MNEREPLPKTCWYCDACCFLHDGEPHCSAIGREIKDVRAPVDCEEWSCTPSTWIRFNIKELKKLQEAMVTLSVLVPNDDFYKYMASDLWEENDMTIDWYRDFKIDNPE